MAPPHFAELPARILVVRLDSLGDVLMCSPAMKALKLAMPGAHLTLLTSRSGAALQPHLPMVDAVMVHEASWMKSHVAQGPAPAVGSDDVQLLERLAAAHEGRGFDLAVIFTTATQSALPAALLCRMAGIPARAAHVRENPYDLLTHWQRETDAVGPGMRHEVQRQLDLVASLGIPLPDDRGLVFALRSEDRVEARRMLAAAGHAPQRPFVLVHPGATAPSRRYPPELYGRAMDDVVRLGWPCIFCAGEPDRSLAVRASEAMGQPALLLTDAMPLGVFGALIEQAAVLVANNSGPAHMAAAVGTPVVCLYALTNPQHTPWLVRTRVLNHEVPCRDCLKSVCPQGHHACLLEVTPGQVSQATLSLLSQAAARSGAEAQPIDLCHEG